MATGEYVINNYVLNCNIDKVLTDDPDLEPDSSLGPWEKIDPDNPKQDYEPICGTRSNNIAMAWYRSFKELVVLAAVGGAFLVRPM